MKCRFCAEEIKDEAILCRFCGAAIENGTWRPAHSTAAPRAPRGSFTIRTAAVLFGLSALLELAFISSQVPLFGAMRGGWVAVLYHCIYVALFLAMGVGLWQRTRWGYLLLFAGTGFYTLDKLISLLDRSSMDEYLRQLADYSGGLEILDKDSMRGLMTTSTLLIVACWWGFALYVYRHRGYFANQAKPPLVSRQGRPG